MIVKYSLCAQFVTELSNLEVWNGLITPGCFHIFPARASLFPTELETCDFHCRLLADQKCLSMILSVSRSSPMPTTQSSILYFCQKLNGQQRNDPLEDQASDDMWNRSLNSQVVGHLPKKHPRVFWHFIKRGGTVKCRVTGSREITREYCLLLLAMHPTDDHTIASHAPNWWPYYC